MDIVELLENLMVQPHQQSIIDSAVDEIVGLREALQKIAAVDDEKLPTPVTQAEGVLWSTLGACVGLARKALGEKE